ncbi:lactococcin 972 family bacteriocin [Frigoribacterium sp. CFBP 13729]|uniref:lactococcin 972 family bacteriocin n=1 Tax=Frigoribacterium sp. CFBP 13729 TaxID=2775293 RepID=UPI001783E0D1|nr:lactococcin 972 family bacteriocin [Frigoribacterium sp. CFBP 13729]MBD8610454.1 lactococcin 972 family bacteriocin [Frigoribacterium sp. CFBP 13729]
MKKTMTTAASAAAALTLAGALLVPTSASAAEPTPAGVEHAVSGSALVPADRLGLLTTEIKEGGQWTYGVDNGLYSNYWHKHRSHGSSVINGNGQKNSSSDVRGGLWSHSRINKTIAGNTAYWRIR